MEEKRFTLIRRLSDGAVKRMLSGAAARMVVKGGYEYVDKETDEDVENLEEVSRAIKKSVLEQKRTGANQSIILPRLSRINPVDMDTVPTRDRKLQGRRIIKKNIDIAPEKLASIREMNVASPPIAVMTKDSNTLKNIIENAKQRRTRR